MKNIIKIQLSNTKSGNKKTQDPTPGFFHIFSFLIS